jgi:hypothetical protein
MEGRFSIFGKLTVLHVLFTATGVKAATEPTKKAEMAVDNFIFVDWIEGRSF